MRRIAPLIAILLFCGGCDGVHQPAAPSGASELPGPPPATPVTDYAATLTASASCAAILPAEARQRTYAVQLRPSGELKWIAPTLSAPPGHAPISFATVSNGTFAFSIDVERDPQSDAFNGLWDLLSGSGFLTISGKGRGTGADNISGMFDGIFAYYPGVNESGQYCRAVDHHFTFVKQ
jgi:hypothetical protein